ncbi:MAG: HPP family protein [Pyrinomonadaceae bacterium]|nr:HPP family protein [Pyrinomonadaceae bacterium]MDQ3253051.1 HPP family protein [Acidobacteriota bacterium]
MSGEQDTLKPIGEADHAVRHRSGLKGEFAFALALLPTLTVLLVFAFVEVLSSQRLLFASLASSAFLIYLDPRHKANTVRTLLFAQVGAALLGFATHAALGAGYLSGGVAMILVIVLMILLDAMHPPAVSTALSFAFRAGPESNLLLFSLAVGVTVTLVLLQRAALWLLNRIERRR